MLEDSTVNQLTSIYHDLCTSFDQGITTQSISFDICKAFDRVWHKGLSKKIEAVGIRGKLALRFQNYLQNRKQAVVIKGKKSEYKAVPSGVPQESVLGLLLFFIYINDITKNIESVIKLIADDTSMSLALKDPDRRVAVLNSDTHKKRRRRKRHKRLMFHKMINYQCPGCLSNLVPPLVSTTNPYHRRRSHERVIPAHKTELYENSFIPSTTQLWNTLPQTIQTNPSISPQKRKRKRKKIVNE